MEKVNIALDIYSIAVCLFLITHMTQRKRMGRAGRCFLFACVFDIVMILGDLSDWCCNGLARPWYPAALQIGQFVYYVSIVPLMLSVWKYVSNYVSAYASVPKLCDRILYLLSAVHLLGCVLTPFTGMYYIIDEQNIYHRGGLVFVASLVPICSYILIVALTLKNRRQIAPRVIAALMSNVWLPMVGHLVQNLFRGVGALNPCITLALLLVYLNVQQEMELQYERDMRELEETKTALMLSQIKPHFLYNSLTAIRRLCEDDPKDARAAINDFSLFLRANMDFISNQTLIPFEQELRHIQSYLNLEQRRFEDSLSVDYNLEITDFCLPALSLQPVVENAVLHGIRKKEDGGTVRISTSETPDHYVVTVTDDGAGFDPGAIAGQEHIGLKNVSRRLELLCKGELLIDSAPGCGTKATILIPREGENENDDEFPRGG